MIPWLLVPLALAEPPASPPPPAAAAPAVEPAARPTHTPAAPAATGEPQSPLDDEQRAALEDYELLVNLDLLQDLEVARYLDLLRMEED